MSVKRPKSVTHPSAPREGMILVLVLVAMAAAVALVLQAQAGARVALRLEARRLARAEIRHAAAETAWQALRALAADADPAVDHTNEVWAKPLVRTWPDGSVIAVRVEDENRWWNVNNLTTNPPAPARKPADVLGRLVALEGVADPMQTVARLREVVEGGGPGRSPGLSCVVEVWPVLPPVAQREPPLTALSRRSTGLSPVNVNTADRTVLRAILGAQGEDVAAALCALRDRRPLAGVADLRGRGRPECRPTLNAAKAYLAVQSRFFSVWAEAGRNACTSRVYALAERGDDRTIQVLRWVQE